MAISPVSERDAANLLGVKPKMLSRFDDVPDHFNGATLGGWLSRQGDRAYGALVINTVSGKATHPQIIWGTPKQRYPFGRTEDEERRYHWPREIVAVRAYEKLDGTNILVYPYRNAAGEVLVTAKTRLTPTLRRGSTYGDFFALWQEAGLHQLAADRIRRASASIAISFELFGHRNHHLVSYSVPLDAAVLFVVRQEGAAVLPPGLYVETLPAATLVAQWEAGSDLTAFYDDLRVRAQAQNRAVDDEHIEGTEGYVLYIREPSGWSQWKAKPESIEAIHWQGDFLPMSVILPTAWNALESESELTVTVVSALLREEFSERLVLASTQRTEKAVAQVLARLAWRERVAGEYAGTGLDWAEDGKGAVMRALSPRFEKREMRGVYQALRETGLAVTP